MKLRNKKTGEIIEVESLDVDSPTEGIVGIPSFDRKGSYNSLAELNKEWEDYDDTKDHWCITFYGKARRIGSYATREEIAECKQIGNYFETKEEAEKAVEKLKAWKRLKDKGFKFDGYDVAHNSNGDLCGQLFYNAGDYCIEDVEKDLDLLFGGEE